MNSGRGEGATPNDSAAAAAEEVSESVSVLRDPYQPRFRYRVYPVRSFVQQIARFRYVPLPSCWLLTLVSWLVGWWLL